MNKMNKEILVDLLHTHVGECAGRKTISKVFFDFYTQEILNNIISAQAYYSGNPDGKFISPEYDYEFDEETRYARNAYETIDTLMGNNNAEFMRFCEGKKLVPGLITERGLKKLLI